MQENERLVAYKDNTQTLLFRAKSDPKGILTLTHSMDITHLNPDNSAAEFVRKTIAGELAFKEMKKPIVVSKDRDPDAQQKLEGEIRLFNLAEKAMKEAVASTSNARLPNLGPKQSGRGV
jgi:hypothetical protein